ncbi:hypothetical protein U1Q18_009286, partial [Sarracenia purpurea var. burkii]
IRISKIPLKLAPPARRPPDIDSNKSHSSTYHLEFLERIGAQYALNLGRSSSILSTSPDLAVEESNVGGISHRSEDFAFYLICKTVSEADLEFSVGGGFNKGKRKTGSCREGEILFH